MDLWMGLLFPFLLGLLGFLEPCSLGVNVVFLQYLVHTPWARWLHGLLFTATRALFLSGLGVLAAFAGQQVVSVQSHAIRLLSLLYLALGVLVVVRGAVWSVPQRFPRRIAKSFPALLGALFGLAVPACASPLIVALLGGAALSGRLWDGFASLFVFGLGLSLPLVVVAASEKARLSLRRLAHERPRVLYSFLTQSGDLSLLIRR